MRRGLRIATVVVGGMVFAPRASAQRMVGPVEPDALPVTWEAPASCPTQRQVQQRMRTMLQDSDSTERNDVTLRMTVRETEGGFSLRVDMTASTGDVATRQLQAARCEDLVAAGVVVAALAIDPGVRLPASPDEESSETPEDVASVPDAPDDSTTDRDARASDRATKDGPVEPPEASPPPGSRPAPAESAPRRPRGKPLNGIVDLGFGLGLGRLAAGPSVLGRLAGGIERGAIRGLVRVSGFGPSRGDAPDGPAGGRFAAGTLGLALCGRLTTATAWAFVGCLASDVGVAAGQGRDTVVRSRTERAPWWGVEAEVGAEFWLSRRLALALRGDGGVVVAAPRFVIDGQGAACCERWAAGVRAGVAVRLGADRER